MKKKPELPGMIWDRRKITLSHCPVIITEDELGYCENYRVSYNLFDINGTRRFIDCSEIFSYETENALCHLASQLKSCDSIYVRADNVPESSYGIVVKFYAKRLLQALSFIKDIKEAVAVGLITSIEDMGNVLPYIQSCFTAEGGVAAA